MGTLDSLRKMASLDGSLEDVFLKMTEEASAEPKLEGASS